MEFAQSALTIVIEVIAIAGFGGIVLHAIWSQHKNWMTQYCPSVGQQSQQAPEAQPEVIQQVSEAQPLVEQEIQLEVEAIAKRVKRSADRHSPIIPTTASGSRCNRSDSYEREGVTGFC